MDLFRFLKVGLGLVLVFVGGKMCVEHWLHVPAEISLLVVVSLLGLSVAASLLWPAAGKEAGEDGGAVDTGGETARGDSSGEAGDDKMNPRE